MRPVNGVMTIGSPTVLTAVDPVDDLESGDHEIDLWLRAESWGSQASKKSNTFVISDGKSVVGFYTLSFGSISRGPDLIPVMVLNRLAVDKQFHGNGIGSALLADATTRVLNMIAERWDIQAFVAHASSEKSREFYLHMGFSQSDFDPMVLVFQLPAVERSPSEKTAQAIAEAKKMRDRYVFKK